MTKIVVLGADYCPFCKKVKEHLDANKIPYKWIDTQTPEGSKERAQKSAKQQYTTIPMVYIDDKFIGGCNDFFKGITNKNIIMPKL